jgi:hypothetical protein
MDVSLNSQSDLPCSTLTVGLAVMEPELCYPYHKHPPAEFYVVLSEGYWYRKDVGCMTLSSWLNQTRSRRQAKPSSITPQVRIDVATPALVAPQYLSWGVRQTIDCIRG